jgi:hypothetical protein
MTYRPKNIGRDLFKFENLIMLCGKWVKYIPFNEELKTENLSVKLNDIKALNNKYHNQYVIKTRDENLWYAAMEELKPMVKKIEEEMSQIEMDKELKREIKKCLMQMKINKNKQTPFCNLLVLVRQIKRFNEAGSEISLKNLTQKEIELIKLNKTAEESKKEADEIEHELIRKMYAGNDSVFELVRRVIYYCEAIDGRKGQIVKEVKKYRIMRRFV